MAEKNKTTTTDDPAKQLLHFVSNASREIKNFLDKVENEDTNVEEYPKSPRSPRKLRTPTTPIPSPIPSPTPSNMSLCDQEVPSLSPRPCMEYPQPPMQRKRRFEMYPDDLVRYCKRNRNASTGEFDETYSQCRFSKRNVVSLPMRQLPSQPLTAPSSNRKDCMYNEMYNQSSCQRLYTNTSYDLQNGNSLRWPNGCNNNNNNSNLNSFMNYNIPSNTRQNIPPNSRQHIPSNSRQHILSNTRQHIPSNTRQQEPTPDFAELVSWMVAEDFLDVETLSSLLAAAR